MKTQIKIDISEISDVLVEVEYHIENDGIGRYEYWGAICFNGGDDYEEIDDIVIIDDLNAEDLEYANKYIDENFYKICETIYEKNLL